MIAEADQGGFGLPEREYYFRDDAKSQALRQAYVAHVQKMFELLGETPRAAAAAANTVLQMETALAKASLGVVARREPANVYHKMTLAELRKITPGVCLEPLSEGGGRTSHNESERGRPRILQRDTGADRITADRELENLLALAPGTLRRAPASAGVRAGEFRFLRQDADRRPEMRPRWKRCVDFTDAELGEALGKHFVEKTFGAEGKARTLKMVDALEKALGQDLEQLPWMTAETRKQALVKLAAIANKIGYPDKWRDYSSVVIRRDDLVGNTQRADAFEFQRQLNKIGKPVDRQEWGMTPPTVNAYYDPSMNDINFPAGILQPPFYDNAMDDAVNFGGIGAVIGHELTHGFDDEGRQFDAKGNLRDWWTPDDAKEFGKRAACIAQEYSKFEVAPGATVNGQLTLGENTADNGGVRIALMALLNDRAARNRRSTASRPSSGSFWGWGQNWCENATDELLRMQAQTDPHSPARDRANGVVSNMPEFRQAFGCKPGQPMVRENACRVW